MIIRIQGIGTRGKASATLIGVLAIGVGLAVLALGAVILVGIVAAVTVVGAGALVYRKLTGRGPILSRAAFPGSLDPSLEVFPFDDAASTAVRPLPPAPDDAPTR